MTQDPFAFHRHLETVASDDVELVKKKDRSYGSSWKKRGGSGAFMMLARKWDRLEELTKRQQYDLFQAIWQEREIQGDDGTVLAEIRDLRRYLLLVEAEMIERGAVPQDASPRSEPRTAAKPVPATEENHYAERATVRYPVELNNTEHNNIPTHLQMGGIYEWIDSEQKWIMKSKFRTIFAVGYENEE